MRRLLTLFGDDRSGQVKLLGAAAVAALAMVALGLTLLYRVDASRDLRDLTIRNCKAIEALKSDIRGTFEATRERILNSPDLDAPARAAALMRIDAELHRYAPKPCP